MNTEQSGSESIPVDDPAHEEHPLCEVCGSWLHWEDCWQCGGVGGRDGEELMAEDPFWYDEDDWEDCDICEGAGGYWVCPALPHQEQAT